MSNSRAPYPTLLDYAMAAMLAFLFIAGCLGLAGPTPTAGPWEPDALPAQQPEPNSAELAFDLPLEYEPPVPYEDMAGLDVETQREMVQRDRIDRMEARVRRLETELSAVISRVFGISGEIGSEGE